MPGLEIYRVYCRSLKKTSSGKPVSPFSLSVVNKNVGTGEVLALEGWTGGHDQEETGSHPSQEDRPSTPNKAQWCEYGSLVISLWYLVT